MGIHAARAEVEQFMRIGHARLASCGLVPRVRAGSVSRFGSGEVSEIDFFSLSNGLRVAIEPNASVRSLAITLLTPAGFVREPASCEGLGALWCEMLLRGAGDLDSREQADAFDRLGASRRVSQRSVFVSISSRTMGDRLEGVLSLIAAMVLRPRFEAEALEASRELALQSLASLADDPQERCALLAREHHYAPPLNRSGYGREETLRAIRREDVVSWWERLAVPDGSILAIAGDVDVAGARERIERIFGGWRGTIEEIELDPRGERGVHHAHDETSQVQIDVLHDGPAAGDPDRVLEHVVQSVLSGGMSGRLFTEVREKRGLCYSVSSGYSPGRDFGTVSAYVGTTPERAEESLRVLLEELERIGDRRDITREEFERAVIGMKARTIFSGESTQARASAMARDIYCLGRPRTLREVSEEIDAVTLDRVLDYLGRRTIGEMTIQTLGPAAVGI